MTLQLTLTLMIVAAAGLYLVRSICAAWRKSQQSCGGGCGCGTNVESQV